MDGARGGGETRQRESAAGGQVSQGTSRKQKPIYSYINLENCFVLT